MPAGDEPQTRLARHRKLAQLVGGHLRAIVLRLRAELGTRRARRTGRVSGAVRVRLAGVPGGVWLRPGTSDFRVFKQIFTADEYAWAAALPNLESVLDCGANVGYVAVDLLRRFPRARVVAVEPDAGNAELCRRNLARFGDAAKVVVAGVWSKSVGLKVESGGGVGCEWGITVRECEPGEPADVQGRSIPDLLDAAGLARIGLLKLDIEGAEARLFAGDTAWLDRVDNLSIELHGDACRAAFARAIADYDYTRLTSGELVVLIGLRRKRDAAVAIER